MTQSPQRFDATKRNAAERADSAKELLAFFINQHTRVLEYRLQKLVFYAEATYYSEHGERLTDVQWNAYMYGMFSEDIRVALDEMESDGAETKRTIYNGNRTITYLDPAHTVDLPDDVETLLTGVHEETETIQTDELASWTKDHPLFASTRYEDYVDFSDME